MSDAEHLIENAILALASYTFMQSILFNVLLMTSLRCFVFFFFRLTCSVALWGYY